MYVQLDYMKPIDGDNDAYVKMEKNIWKPIHKARVANGELYGWYLYQVLSPSGTAAEYNYVTVNILSNATELDEDLEEFESLVKRVHPDKLLEDLNRQAVETRDLVRSEIFKSVQRAPESLGQQSKILLVDFMKVSPPMTTEYEKCESDIWRPLHEQRIKDSLIDYWGLYQLQFPGGSGYPYSHCTVTGFGSMSQVVDAWPDEIWGKVHPNSNEDALIKMTHQTRDLVSSQTWRLLDYVSSSPSN